MPKNFLNFFNPKNNSDKIYSREDINQMSPEEFAQTREALYHQMAEVGIPSESQLATSPDVIYVRAYTRDDGTKVRAHYRARRGRTYVEQVSANDISPETQQYVGSPLLGYVSANMTEPDLQMNKYDPLHHPINTFHSAINVGLNQNYPLTKDTMDMFIHGVNNYTLNNGIKLHKPGDPDDRLKILSEDRRPPKNCYGVEFTEDSEISKIISQSSKLKSAVEEYFSEKKIKPSLNKWSFMFSAERDLARSIHKADIIGCYKQDGYYKGYLYDLFDFEPDYYFEDKNNNLLLGAANLYAAGMQWFGLGKKYYMIIPFKIKI